MSDKPDFEKLRAARNKLVQEALQRTWKKLGGAPNTLVQSNFNPNACYCDCPNGPCEHKWDGEENNAGQVSSVTCSRCGVSAFSHDMRVMP